MKPTLTVFLILAALLHSISFGQEQEKIVETVEVINVQVPVRVYQKGKPVSGLTKSDFNLFIDGKEYRINGFNEVRKQIQLKPTQVANQTNPRLFLLIFNVSNYHIDLKGSLDTLFSSILKPQDRIIVFTNHYSLNDRPIADLDRTKSRILDMLKLENKVMKREYLFVENRLRQLERQFGEMNTEPQHDLRMFFDEYLNILDEFRGAHFQITTEQYIKLAEYLSRQNLDKWILNFYQVSLFPQLKWSGPLYTSFRDDYWRLQGGGEENEQMMAMMMDQILLETELRLGIPDNLPAQEIGSLFINSGATVHSLLTKRTDQRFMRNFEWKPIGTDSEQALVQMTKQGGGEVMFNLKEKDFIKRISQHEDIIYYLTYEPDRAMSANPKIVVKLNKPEYKPVFDHQQRPDFFQNKIEQVRKQMPPVNIRQLGFQDGILYFTVSGISMGNGADTIPGNIRVRIQMINAGGEVVQMRQKEAKTRIPEIEFRISMPRIQKGKYDIMVEITDLNSGRNDLILEEIKL